MSLHSTSGQKAFATVRPATVLGIRLLAVFLAVCGVAQPASAAGPTGKLTREENSGGTVGLAGKWILSQRTGIIPPLKDVVASLSGDRRFAEALAGLSVRTCVYRVSHADPEAHYYFLATQPDLDWVAARQRFSVGHWIHDIGPPLDQCPAAEADAARLIPGRQSPKYALHEARLPGPLGSRGQPGLATGCAWVQVTSDVTYVLTNKCKERVSFGLCAMARGRSVCGAMVTVSVDSGMARSMTAAHRDPDAFWISCRPGFRPRKVDGELYCEQR